MHQWLTGLMRLSSLNAMETEKPNIKKPTYVKRGGNGGAREGAGRPAFVPDDAERRQVEALAGYGLPFEHIAVLVRKGISLDTLRAHFASELVTGKAKANGQIGKTLFQKATNGDTTAMIWWTKTQMRWREVSSLEVSGAGGKPLQIDHRHQLNLSSLSDEELLQLEQLLDRAAEPIQIESVAEDIP